MRNYSIDERRAAVLAGLLLAAGSAAVRTAGAQATDPRWQPWLGCWVSADARATRGGAAAGDMVCVIPAQHAPGVEVAVIANGRVLQSEIVNPTGQRVPKTVESCPGWESASWSSDERRLALRSEYTCGKTTVKGSSLFAMTTEGEWIEVRGALVGTNETVRAVRYRPLGVTLVRRSDAEAGDSMPFATRPMAGLASRSARLDAGQRVTPQDVLEVSHLVDPPVVGAWLNEMGEGFTLDAKELVRLADGGMPPNLIDLMVALSYPKVFAVTRAAPERRVGTGGAGTVGGMSSLYPARRYGSAWNCGYGYVPMTYNYFDDACYSGYYGYNAYGYGPYGYGPYGYGSYGYGNGYYWGSNPFVIVQTTPGSAAARGQAVNGAGYTRRSGGGASPSSGSSGSYRAPSSSGSGSSSSSGSTSSGGTSGSTSSGSGDGGRTAKPRPPG